MSGGSVHTIEKNTEAFVVRSKEIGLEVAKYVAMSGDRYAGRSRYI